MICPVRLLIGTTAIGTESFNSLSEFSTDLTTHYRMPKDFVCSDPVVLAAGAAGFDSPDSGLALSIVCIETVVGFEC